MRLSLFAVRFRTTHSGFDHSLDLDSSSSIGKPLENGRDTRSAQWRRTCQTWTSPQWGGSVPIILNDLRYALRQLRKTPGMAVLAILTLALGVGANTAIFTVIESVLLRPLPYTHSDRLVYIGGHADDPGYSTTSWMNYHDIQTQSTLLQSVAGYTEDVSVLHTQDSSLSIVAPHVTT